MVQCLLIDKNPGERQRLQLILEGLGLNCDERSGVEEGIRFCHENHPEVVMMEASLLPATREFLRLVKYQGRSSHKPVVLLYADKPDLASVGESMVEGASEFLVRPFDANLLKFKLEQAGVLAH